MKKGSIRITLSEEEVSFIRQLLIEFDLNNITVYEVVQDLLEKIK